MFNFLAMSEIGMQILIISLIIVGLIIFILLFVFAEFRIFKHYRKKVEENIVKIIPFEKQRLDLVKRCFEQIKSSKIKYNNSMIELLDDITSIYDDLIVEKYSYAKQGLDVLLSYIKKFDNKYKVVSENDKNEVSDTFITMQNFYDEYNKSANMYNAFLGLWLLRPFVKKYTRAAIF